MMKRTLILVSLIAAPLVFAADDHDDHPKGHHHEEAVTAGPNGGHVVRSKTGHFAFEVVADSNRKARITMLDDHGKPVAPGETSITGVAGERSAPVKLVFAAGAGDDAGVLISDKPLPPGSHLPMVLVIKTGKDAKPVTERFELHLH